MTVISCLKKSHVTLKYKKKKNARTPYTFIIIRGDRMTTNASIPTFLKRFLALSTSERRQYTKNRFQELQRLQEKRTRDADDPHSPFSMVTALSQTSERKNRYTDIIPFDANRVLLNTKPSDYINASHIVPPFGIRRSYIATQGPLENTAKDFWLMTIEQKSEVIVCLTPEQEVRRGKCWQYWPTMNHERHIWHPIDSLAKIGIQCEDELYIEDADTELSRMAVTVYDDAQVLDESIISHLKFLGWQDHCALDTASHILGLISKANELRDNNESAPVIVHCSAGCGRTGTFCVVDSGLELLQMIHNGSIEDDGRDFIFELVDSFRQQRVTMVQTGEQYYFCYLALLDALGVFNEN
jgi:protein tyrosine phosphatase